MATIADLPATRLVRELIPFYLVLIAVIFLTIVFPWVVTAPGNIVFG